MISSSGISIYFEKQDENLATELSEVVAKTVSIVKKLYGIQPRAGIEVYVMRSWIKFIFLAAPFHRKAIQLILFPLLYFSYSRIWKVAGGWNVPFGKTTAVGVKPPCLIDVPKSSRGDSIFKAVDDPNVKFTHIACHEITHALTSKYAFPTWLNEGVAMVAVDEFQGSETVKRESLLLLDQSGSATSSKLNSLDNRLVYVRGYWLTRFLLESHPQAVLKLFQSQDQTEVEIETQIARLLAVDQKKFWEIVSPMLVKHFGVERKMPRTLET